MKAFRVQTRQFRRFFAPVPSRTRWLRGKSFALALVLALLPATVRAQQGPVTWTAKGPRSSVSAGQKFTVGVAARISSGWHIYSITQPPGGPVKTTIALRPGQPFRLSGPVVGPTPHKSYDPNFQMNVETYEGSAAFTLPIVADAKSPTGNHELAVAITFQSCNQTMCLPPKTIRLNVPVNVVPKDPPTGAQQDAKGGKAAAASLVLAADPVTKGSLARAGSGQNGSPDGGDAESRRSFLSFLWLAAIMGALSLLTPCVFPMVPITVSYFSKYASQSRRGAIGQSLAFGLGIIITFSGLGLALSLIFGAAGINRLAANPWVNLLISVFFLAFAVSLLGFYLIRLPHGLVSRVSALGSNGPGKGLLGTAFMGLAFTLTSFTCTAPFLGTLFVLAARGNWRWPLGGMLAYSATFAFPFVVLAMAPQLITQLPRSGAWMNSVKVVMGFLEIAAAMKFLSNADLVWHVGIFTRQTVLAIWIACGVATVLYVLGLVRFASERRVESVGGVRLTTAMTFLTITILLVPGLLGRPLGTLDSFLPPLAAEPSPGKLARSSPTEIHWILNNYSAALAQARQQNKLVFVDFTGYTCTNCRWMEANMFPQAAIRSRLAKLVCVRLYTDGSGPLYERQQKMEQAHFGTVALPLYAIVRPDGSSVVTFEGLTRETAKFVSFLDRGLAAGPRSMKRAS